MNKLRGEIAKIIDNVCQQQRDGYLIYSLPFADQILALIKEAGYVRLPPDSAILENISLLRNIGGQDE